MKTLFFVLLVASIGVAAFTQDEEQRRIEPPFAPRNPIVMGQGGTFTANAEGYNSFFTNPAGFARKNEFSIVSANPWLYSTKQLIDWSLDSENPLRSAVPASVGSRPFTTQALTAEQEALVEQYVTDAGIEMDLSAVDFSTISLPREVNTLTNAPTGATAEDVIVMLAEGTLVIDQSALEAEYPDTDFDSLTAEELANFKDVLISEMASEVVVQVAVQAMDLPPGFFRVGANAGVGIIMQGVGVGVFTQVDGRFAGDTILSTSGGVRATAAGVVGYSHTLSLGRMVVCVGADIRPMIVYRMPVVASDLITDMIDGTSISPDYFLGSPGLVSTALAFDLGATLDLGPLTLGLSVRDVLNTRYEWHPTNLNQLMANMALPDTEPTVESITPMRINIGASFHPDLGRLSVLLDPRFHVDVKNVAFVPEYYENFNPWEMINLGAEITMLRFLKARAGFSGGYFTGGVGAKLLFMEANIAAAVDATTFDTVSDFGVSAEIAFRF